MLQALGLVGKDSLSKQCGHCPLWGIFILR